MTSIEHEFELGLFAAAPGDIAIRYTNQDKQTEEIMGWNAAASVVQKDFYGPGDDDIKRISDGHPALADFVQASKAPRSPGATWDCTFDIGLLCTRSTGAALFDAVGEPMPHSGLRYPEEVQQLLAKADWTRSSDKYEESNKACAKAFLEICAKHSLAIDLG